MTREEALEGLSAASAHSRGRAARALADLGRAGDLEHIRKALKSETVAYVQYALQDTIKRLTRNVAPQLAFGDETAAVPEEVRQQIYGQAVEWVTGFLLHEIASPIGLARLSGKLELGDHWEASATRRHLETVHRIFDAIEMLKSAAGVPRPQEFDLAAMIDDLGETEVPRAMPWTSAIGLKPFLIKGDPALIRMVIGNGLRNAVEAVEALGVDPQPHSVTINWGETDVDYWVSVLDRGIGIVGPSETAFEVGISTKKNHSGFGLAIARQAVQTMIGVLSLHPARDGGAVYLARWQK
jgi:signal transduction histidine kinase